MTDIAVSNIGKGADLRDGGSLVSRVVQELRHLIREESLKIGDIIPSEAALCERLGVSRTVVREAYKAMAAMRLIDVGNGRRARVAAVDNVVLALGLDHAVQVDQITAQQILDVRRTIEMRTVSLATLHRTDRQADEIASHAAHMRSDFLDGEKVIHHDIAFHEAIARSTRNPMFSLIVGSFHLVTRQTWQTGWTARDSDAARYASVECHEAIAAAIKEKDAQRAIATMAQHFDDTVTVLLSNGIN
jgi:GntR family transcriptional regulator, transcriptional repressor for pyruvate dehydrogenase complex